MAEPIERLEAINRMTRHAKVVTKGVPAQVLNRISDELPGCCSGSVSGRSAQIAYRLGQAILANTTVKQYVALPSGHLDVVASPTLPHRCRYPTSPGSVTIAPREPPPTEPAGTGPDRRPRVLRRGDATAAPRAADRARRRPRPLPGRRRTGDVRCAWSSRCCRAPAATSTSSATSHPPRARSSASRWTIRRRATITDALVDASLSDAKASASPTALHDDDVLGPLLVAMVFGGGNT